MTKLNEAAKAKAIADAEAANAAILSNQEAARNGILAKAGEYGAHSAEGDMSLTKVAFLFNQACRSKVMTVDDARAVYVAYTDGRNAAMAAKGSVEIEGANYQTGCAVVTTDGKSSADNGALKAAVSIFATFGRPAVVVQGLGFYDEVRTMWLALDAGKRQQKSLYNAFVAANRAVSKAADGQNLTADELAAGKFDLPEDCVAGAITAEEGETGDGSGKAKAKTPDRKLADLMASLVKLADSGNYSADIAEAVVALRKVTVLTDADKARAKFEVVKPAAA